MEPRVILRDISAIAYAEESELMRMHGTLERFLGRDVPKSLTVMREVRRALLSYLEKLINGKLKAVKRVLRPDSDGRLDELELDGITIPELVTETLSRHLRGIYPEQVRRCDSCFHIIVTARRPRPGVNGSYCNNVCFDRALYARKRYAVSA